MAGEIALHVSLVLLAVSVIMIGWIIWRITREMLPPKRPADDPDPADWWKRGERPPSTMDLPDYLKPPSDEPEVPR